MDYKDKDSSPNMKIEMSVIVQVMVSTDCSGVVFTKDPTGSSDFCVLEAAYGLCEGVVNGRVSCDKVRYDLLAQKVVDYRVEYQRRRIVLKEEGTQEDIVPYLDRSRIKLPIDKLSEVMAMSKKIKNIFRVDVDIELGFYDNELYVFQARKITTV